MNYFTNLINKFTTVNPKDLHEVDYTPAKRGIDYEIQELESRIKTTTINFGSSYPPLDSLRKELEELKKRQQEIDLDSEYVLFH